MEEDKNLELVDFSKVASQFQNALILKILEVSPEISVSEIFEIIKHNGVVGVSYDTIRKNIATLLNRNLIQKEETIYMITEEGRKEVSDIILDFKRLVVLLDKMSLTERKPEKHVSLPSIYNNCMIIKTVPYTITHFNGASEDDFFLNIIPAQNWVYHFDGRGLGKGNHSNIVIAFQNNNLIKFVAVLDYYVDLNGLKEMHLNRGSVHKLSIPITNRDMQQVQQNFRFIRNKQTISDVNDVEEFKHLLEKHW